jgi:tetratricopeptide (TPR) repeat protein
VGDPGSAASILQDPADGGTQADWLNARGVIAACADQPGEAASWLAEAVALAPANPVYATNLARVRAYRMPLGEEQADLAGCEQVLGLLKRVDPEAAAIDGSDVWYPCKPDRPRLEIARAVASLPPGPERNRRLLALMEFRLHSFAGAIHARLGRLAEADAHLKRAAAILPDDGYTLAARGDLSVAQGRRARAERAYRGASEVEPFYVEACIKLAQCLLERGRQREAVTDLEQLLESTPGMQSADRADALAVLGIAASRTGALDRTREALQTSLALNPQQPEVRGFLASLPRPQAQPV